MAKINDDAYIRLFDNPIVAIIGRDSNLTVNPAAKYAGMFLKKKDDVLVFGVYVEKDGGLKYKENDIVSVSFVEARSMYNLNVKILGIRKASPKKNPEEDFEIEIDGEYDRYIFDVFPLTEPEMQQRREFYRLPLGIQIYYKKTESENNDNNNNADGGKSPEMLKGYAKMITEDISAGGFRCISKIKMEEGTVLDCMLAVGHEVLPAKVQILSAKPAGAKYGEGLYDIRAIFNDMDDMVRDRIVRYVFMQQRQRQAKIRRKKKF